MPAAHAFDSPTPDYKIRLDLTPKYRSAYRLKNPSPALTQLHIAVDPGTVNEDDGDHNFHSGLISSRFDLLAELDVSGPRFGGPLSGSAWHDAVYLRGNAYAGTPLLVAGQRVPALHAPPARRLRVCRPHESSLLHLRRNAPGKSRLQATTARARARPSVSRPGTSC